MNSITWSQIEAECGDYRAGFVATFKKYEGRDTDERDGQGRPMVVSQRTFAEHMGIPYGTFREWIAGSVGGQQPRQRDRVGEAVKRMPTAEKAKLAAELLADPEVEVAPSVIAQHAARPDVARAIARHDDAREAVEEAAIDHRARHIPDDIPDPDAAGRAAGASMARQLDTDPVAVALRAAARDVAEAILIREEFGIRDPDQVTEALDRLRHLIAAVEVGDNVRDDDRAWLESIGVTL